MAVGVFSQWTFRLLPWKAIGAEPKIISANDLMSLFGFELCCWLDENKINRNRDYLKTLWKTYLVQYFAVIAFLGLRYSFVVCSPTGSGCCRRRRSIGDFLHRTRVKQQFASPDVAFTKKNHTNLVGGKWKLSANTKNHICFSAGGILPCQFKDRAVASVTSDSLYAMQSQGYTSISRISLHTAIGLSPS